MLGFFVSKDDRLKQVSIYLMDWFNPIKIKVYKYSGYLDGKIYKYSFPIVKVKKIEMNVTIAGFHIYTKDKMIVIKDESTEYKFPPEMLGRVINGWMNKKIVK